MSIDYTFNWTDQDIRTVSAGSFVIGRWYKIITPGSTDFTLVGAANSNVNTTFIATGVGTGNGVASWIAFIVAGGATNGPDLPLGPTDTNLTFTGKGSVDWGRTLQQNIAKVLENYASPTGPSPATLGQTWYDPISTILHINTATGPTGAWSGLATIDMVLGENFANDTGVADAYVVALVPPLTSYIGTFNGKFIANFTNLTTAPTLNAGAGSVQIWNQNGTTLAPGDIAAGELISYTYHAGKFYLDSVAQSQTDVRYAKLAGLATQTFMVSGPTGGSASSMAVPQGYGDLRYAAMNGNTTHFDVLNPPTGPNGAVNYNWAEGRYVPINSTENYVNVSNPTGPTGAVPLDYANTHYLGINATGPAAVNSTNSIYATNLVGGPTGAVPYQNGTDVTALLAPSTAGYVMTTQGAGLPPTWAPAGSGGLSLVVQGTTNCIFPAQANWVMPDSTGHPLVEGVNYRINQGGTYTISFTIYQGTHQAYVGTYKNGVQLYLDGPLASQYTSVNGAKSHNITFNAGDTLQIFTGSERGGDYQYNNCQVTSFFVKVLNSTLFVPPTKITNGLRL